MNHGGTVNVAASVRARLLNHARANRQAFQSVLVRYGVERLLYRLSVSPYVDGFVLKGAQLLLVHAAEPHRPTKDLDLLGFGSDDPDDLVRVFREVCQAPAEHDGLTFDAAGVTAEVIREASNYGGVRVRLVATLDGARIPLQVDVGFGDVVTPGAELVRFPVLLGGPAARLRAYPLATVVAEKLESLTQLGLATSRMKDLYDLWYIIETFDVRGDEVREAVTRTFERRGTPFEPAPAVFTAAFWDDPSKRAQWSAFLERNDLHAPELEEVARGVAARVALLLTA
jgi:predicted nucleotidyltransferase component of viral defense system